VPISACAALVAALLTTVDLGLAAAIAAAVSVGVPVGVRIGRRARPAHLKLVIGAVRPASAQTPSHEPATFSRARCPRGG